MESVNCAKLYSVNKCVNELKNQKDAFTGRVCNANTIDI